MNKTMSDKELMTDILTSEKALSALYHYAVQESSSEPLHCDFKNILNDALQDQNNVFKSMEQKGWYPMEQAPQQQVDKVKNKFSAS